MSLNVERTTVFDVLLLLPQDKIEINSALPNRQTLIDCLQQLDETSKLKQYEAKSRRGKPTREENDDDVEDKVTTKSNGSKKDAHSENDVDDVSSGDASVSDKEKDQRRHDRSDKVDKTDKDAVDDVKHDDDNADASGDDDS